MKDGPILFVGEAAGEEEAQLGRGFVGGAGAWLSSLCKGASIRRENASTLNVIGCRPPSNIFPTDQKWSATSREDARTAVEYCKANHFTPSLNRWRAKHPQGKIFALGAHALSALTEREGIQTWRGSPLPLRGEHAGGPKVIPTLHPAFLMRQAKLMSVVIRDLRKGLTPPPERYNLYPTLAEVKQWNARKFAFDFEWDWDGNITLCGLSEKPYHAMVVPFEGQYIVELQRIFEQATALIGHNIINADLSHIDRLGWDISKAELHDTMLKQHLIQPDMPHDLGFVASVFTNKVFWKGKGHEEEDDDGNIVQNNVQWKTWDKSWAIPREFGGYGGCRSGEEAYRLYNARDTDGELQIDFPISQTLTKFCMDHTYWHVSVPVAFLCREMAERGFRIDTSKLGVVRDAINVEVDRLEATLPEGLAPYEEEVGCNVPAPAGTFRPKTKRCQGTVKGGTKHPPVEITFTSLEDQPCPTCHTNVSPGKMAPAKIIKGTKKVRVVPYNSTAKLKDYTAKLKLREVHDAKTGNLTTGKRARKIWGKEHPEFNILSALKQKITLRNNFAKDALLGQERMYFNLKVHGTSEGRLSASGKRPKIDLNIQNQPETFRDIYIPDHPGWVLLNLDIVQGENMLTTWLAHDWERWERLNTAGYDEHADLASRIFGRPVSKALAKLDPSLDVLRQIGKKINHGRNYGMGARKQLESLVEMGFDTYTEADVKEFIEIWKGLNPGTCRWQNETIAVATKQGYLCNPFGRRRWFQSRDIATKALAFLPASTLADMVLRMMIAHYPDQPRIAPSIHANGLEVFQPLVDGWYMTTQVHDSLVLQGPEEGWKEQAARSTAIMGQHWPQLEGFHFSVETKMSTESWGRCKVVKLD